MQLTNKTFKELTEGKKIVRLGQRLERGYMSRKTTDSDLDSQIVKIAERGDYKGKYFIYIPCYFSSRYKIRQYFSVREGR